MPEKVSRQSIFDRIIASRAWKVFVGSGIPKTPYDSSALMTHNFFLHFQAANVHKETLKFNRTFYLGGISLLLFIVLTLTGTMLMFYYRPAIPTAYYDMQDLRFVVSFGRILRNLHRWAAELMIIFVWLHMFRVFWTKSYEKPRDFNWIIGVILLVLTLALSFTGYLLPWDQLAIWAVTVATNIVGYAPYVGPILKYLALGGHTVGENALIRFYVLHIFVLPLIATIFVAVHFWRVRKDGMSLPPGFEESSNVRE